MLTFRIYWHLIRVFGVFGALCAVVHEAAFPYFSVHEIRPDGSSSEWKGGYRAWRWSRHPGLPRGRRAKRRTLLRAYSCFMPMDFPLWDGSPRRRRGRLP